MPERGGAGRRHRVHGRTAVPPPDGVFARVREIKAARARDRKLIAQVSCTPLTMDFTLASPYCFESLAAWKPARVVVAAALLLIPSRVTLTLPITFKPPIEVS